MLELFLCEILLLITDLYVREYNACPYLPNRIGYVWCFVLPTDIYGATRFQVNVSNCIMYSV